MDSSTVATKLKEQILLNLDPKANITIVDETYKHLKHKGYTPGKYHFLLNINSQKLNDMKKINSHRQIYKVANELMPYIHALAIKIGPNEDLENA